MKNRINNVLKACIGQARKGDLCLNVFDLMYETSLTYPELKDELDKLVLKNELAVVDLKTYKFTGDINRVFEDTQTQTRGNTAEDADAARRDYLEKRRQEIIEKLYVGNENEDTAELDEEELRYKALKLCIEKNTASVSMFQRAFPIGYMRACRLVDWMEEAGYISAAENSKPRKVLITLEEFNKIYNE